MESAGNEENKFRMRRMRDSDYSETLPGRIAVGAAWQARRAAQREILIYPAAAGDGTNP
jgi:hypothetical protein